MRKLGLMEENLFSEVHTEMRGRFKITNRKYTVTQKIKLSNHSNIRNTHAFLFFLKKSDRVQCVTSAVCAQRHPGTSVTGVED